MDLDPRNTKLARWLKDQVRETISGLRKKGGAEARARSVAAPPGIEHHPLAKQPPGEDEVALAVTDFGENSYRHQTFASVDALLEFLQKENYENRWVDVAGLHPYVINRLRECLDFHTLAAEDVFNTPQRPKVETYDGSLFVISRAIIPLEHGVTIEQVSFVYFPERNLLLTFRESMKDTIWKRVQERVERKDSRLRVYGASYLLYALLDGVTDLVFPALEQQEDLLDNLEEACLDRPRAQTQEVIHTLRREMVQIRRSLVPIKDMIDELHRDEGDYLPDEVETFFRDVLDHALQAIEMLDTNRSRANDLHDLYMTLQAHYMNEIMKVLTIMASFFIPITFLAGVYGMNFEHIPELQFRYSYPIFWGIVIATVIGLFAFFRRKGWF